MNALIIGKKDGFRRTVSDELSAHDYEVVRSDDRASLPLQDFDVCVDMSARSISDVKRVANNFRKRISHYILLSSCRVYPPTPRLFPWNPEEVDLCDETGYSTVDKEIRRYRAAERELKHIGSRKMPWSILRPAIVEAKKDPDENNMWWFVSRILDGGPIVLPDDDDPLFRHISEADLAQAIRVIAGRKEAYFQTIHVTGHTLLSFESYARLVMNGLDKKVPVIRVPGAQWKAASLDLPMGKDLRSSFIDNSLVLDQMGWQPADEREWVGEYARYLVDHPLSTPAQRKTELALLDLPEQELPEPGADTEPENWRLVGTPGKPSSFRLEYFSKKEEMPAPLLRTRKLAMGSAEERLLVEPSTDTAPRIMGHNALLELVDPAGSDMPSGSFYIPLARRPCGDTACSCCAKYVSGLFGVTDDGFGEKFVSLPQQHLVPVPAELAGAALLADPLASLLSILPALLNEHAGPVWIFGERIEALLATLLAVEAGRPVIHVGRTKVETRHLPVVLKSMPLQQARKKAKDGSLEQPTMVVNLSGAKDGENLLASALFEGGFLITPFSATKSHRRRVNINLPLAAPGRLWLELAIEKLGSWSAEYDLQSFLQPIPFAHYHDLFIAAHFRQSCIDTTGVGK